MIRHSAPRLLAAAIAALATLLPLSTAGAAPADGSDAPPVSLSDLSGKQLSTVSLAPRTIVLVFGELNHDGTKQACADLLEVLSDPRLDNSGVVPIMVIASDAPPAQLKEVASQGRYPAVILDDPKRDAFGAYRVLVVPTVVVVDGKGKVVHSMPGFLQRFKEILTDSILLSLGKESKEQFEQSIDPKGQSAAHETVRADRLVHLGTELTKHGLYELAEARFTEATKLSPGHVGATLGLGELMLKQNRLSDAEPLFRSVLAEKPDSVEAALGIVAVEVGRGGDELSKAEASLKKILEKDPRQARAWYLMGQVHQSRGNSADAAGDYRKAAELALDL